MLYIGFCLYTIFLLSNGCSLGGWEESMLPSPPRFYSCKWHVALVEPFVINVEVSNPKEIRKEEKLIK